MARLFTLLELIVCIAILSLVASLLAFPIKGMVQEHRFYQKVKEVRLLISQVHALALTYQSDMELCIYKEKGCLYCEGRTDEPLKIFKPLKLEGIARIHFNSQEIKESFRIYMSASGHVDPTGIFTFYQDKISAKLDMRRPLWMKLERKKE